MFKINYFSGSQSATTVINVMKYRSILIIVIMYNCYSISDARLSGRKDTLIIYLYILCIHNVDAFKTLWTIQMQTQLNYEEKKTNLKKKIEL